MNERASSGGSSGDRLNLRSTFSGKHLFITGVTGFVGKVLLALVASELRGVRRVSVLVRTNRQYRDARERFDAVVALSEPFQEVARRIGNEALHAWCDDVVHVVAGDITKDNLGIADDVYDELTQRDPVDLILHCAGNVNFNPPIDQALAVNSMGAAHKIEFARAANCPLVHMSTCFVAGAQSGPIPEGEQVVGFTPNGRPFDPERELADAIHLAQEVRRRADAQSLECRFLEEARDRLTERGLDYDNPERLQQAFETCKTRWINDELTREGMERAQQWGWPNTYTYTKSLGEQLTQLRAQAEGVKVSIVRPAIVESALNFPFPGWNEGINTCAPIVYVLYKGHRFVPCNPDNILDLIAVDDVSRGTLLAGAALLQGEEPDIFQLCSGDVNPLTMRRAVELSNFAWRKRYDQDEKNLLKRNVMRNLDSVAVDRKTYERLSAPQVGKFTKKARGLLNALPSAILGPAQPLVRQLDRGLGALNKATNLCDTIFTVFKPFIEDNNPVFSSRKIRALADRLDADEKAVFGLNIEAICWRNYWVDIHMVGLHKWVFGELDDRTRPVKKVARAQDLIEVFRTTTRAHAERKALSLYSEHGGVEVSYTYSEFWDSACRVAAWLKNNQIEPGDRVVLMSKNEPAWPMIYFGILMADAVAVPIDYEMPELEVQRILQKSEARLIIVHESIETTFDVATAVVGDVFEAEPLATWEQRDRKDEVASLLFTSGTTGDPKGVMLTHGNFTALLASLQGTFRVDRKDRFLSVLPLFHTFEFSCGLLMPTSVGAHIMFVDTLEGPVLRGALKAFRPTGLIGVPALWDVLHRRIETEVSDRGQAAHMAFMGMLRLSQYLRKSYGINFGPMVFGEVHRMLGGNIRHLISGGAALSGPVLNAFEGLGFELLEGYGLTEAAPVLSVRRPGDRKGGGSVGRQLPGVDIQIINPDELGVGEVIARGDNVMAGYFNDHVATEQTVRKGWLHTGDLGKLDKDGRLTLVGRRKELIVTSSGKNVYPDELEPLYADHPLIDELCIVGIPDPQGDQRVSALIVPVEYPPEDYQAQIKNHFTRVGTGLANHQRIRTMRFWPEPLPRTATRKVKRKEVRAELIKLLAMSKTSRKEGHAVPGGREPAWLYGAVAGLTGLEAVDLGPETHLIQELGLSSLQLVELRLLMEERGGVMVDGEDLAGCETIQDLVNITHGVSTKSAAVMDVDEADDKFFTVPGWLSSIGRDAIGRLQRGVYESIFSARIRGREHIPRNQQVLVISNHSSHLDMGLVKYALADYAPNLSALAASDYFFDTQYKRDFVEPFTNLIPVERTGSLESSLRHAEEALGDGRIVLVFPEGTRSVSGELQSFKHGVGYLQHKSGLPVLPLFLRGTHRSLPKGSAVPVNRRLSALIGPVIPAEFLAKEVDGKNRVETYGIIAERLEQAMIALRDGDVYPWLKQTSQLKIHDDGLADLFSGLVDRFQPSELQKKTTWYFSLGEKVDGKWTLTAGDAGVDISPGRPKNGGADCVLKTDVKTFRRIVEESYVPTFAEFTDGRVKTNDPNLLMQFKSAFNL
ncbi:MAG: AMP-binding protein [Myxococcota bacterium]|nr:AMP-binding protein [Myxococcota bacterium]